LKAKKYFSQARELVDLVGITVGEGAGADFVEFSCTTTLDEALLGIEAGGSP